MILRPANANKAPLRQSYPLCRIITHAKAESALCGLKTLLTLFLLTLFTLNITAAKQSQMYAKDLKLAARMSTDSLLSRGNAFFDKDDDGRALVYYMVGCSRLADGISDHERVQTALCHLKAGNVYYKRGRYANALEFYVKGLKICESCKDKKDIGRFYNNIGNIYCVFRDFEKGLYYYRQGLRLSRQNHDRETELKINVNMVSTCTVVGDIKAAWSSYRAVERLRDRNDNVTAFLNRLNLGILLDEDDKYNSSLKVYRGLVGFVREKKLSPLYLCSSYQQIYKCYTRLGRPDSAFVYINLCQREAEANGIMHKFIETFKDRADLLEREGNLPEANVYRSRYMQYRDSVLNQREFDVVKNTQFEYEINKVNHEIEQLHTRELDRQRTIRTLWLVTLSAIVVATVIGVLLMKVRRQKKSLDASYSDLYQLNRKYLTSIDKMKARLAEKAASPVEKSPVTDNAVKPEGENHGPENTTKKEEKYKTSNLNDSQRDIILRAIVDVMENTTEFCSSDFTLERMATLVGSNSKYVSQVVNACFHKNFSSFVNEYRIDLACHRLADREHYGNYTTRGIATSVGFNSYTAFVTVFRKITGLTPSMYQKKAMEEASGE